MPTTIESVPFWMLKAVALAVGASFGSFANVLIHRLPLGESIVSPGSSCPSCGKSIRWYDNIPVLSYAILMGRCRHCRTSISLRYPLVELCTAVLSLACLFLAVGRLGPLDSLGGTGLLWFFSFAFCFLLVVITFIDLEHWRIPPSLTLTGAGLGFLAAVLAGDFTGVGIVDSLVGAAVGALPVVILIEVYFRLMKREGMGYGDVMLLGMVGATFGYMSLPFIFLASSLQGLLVAVPMLVIGGRKAPPWEGEEGEDPPSEELRHAPVPFGPFIAMSALEWLFFGPTIMSWLLP